MQNEYANIISENTQSANKTKHGELYALLWYTIKSKQLYWFVFLRILNATKPFFGKGPLLEKRRVAVRTLVEAVMLSGSLSAMASSARLLDGIRGHQALQAIAEEGARSRVSVSGTVCSAHIELTVYGRIDRLYGENRVEEIKTLS